MKKSAMRKIVRIQRKAARLFVVLSTLVLMVVALINIAPVGAKIVWTQVKMAYYHFDISDSERQRDSLQQQVYDNLGIPGYARSLQSQADGFDAQVQRSTEARKALRNSDDSVVAWAADGDFEFGKLLIGLFVLLALCGFIFLIYHNFVAVVAFEEKLLFKLLSIVFATLQCAFSLLAHVCGFEKGIFSLGKKTKKAKMAEHPSNVVSFNKRRVG